MVRTDYGAKSLCTTISILNLHSLCLPLYTQNLVWVPNVFLKYGLGAKRLSEIWLGCETSF